MSKVTKVGQHLADVVADAHWRPWLGRRMWRGRKRESEGNGDGQL